MRADEVRIRPEQAADLAATREVNRRAFGQEQEGVIVDALRANGGALLSLVASLDDCIIGHILYSPAQVGHLGGAALGPMAVLPEYQRRRVGSRLVEAGNQLIEEAGYPFIVVLGHPAFYPRFGFQPARRYGLACEWEVPDEVFMVRILDSARMRGATGMVRYRPEFSAAP
jgi:putative acetyltransferase